MKQSIISIIAILCMAFSSPAFAMASGEEASGIAQTESTLQSGKEAKKLAKEKKKQEKKAKKEAEKKRKAEEKRRAKEIEEYQDSVAFEIAKGALDDMHFVIVADRIKFRRTTQINVNSTTNFVLVQGDNATVQFALERGLGGINGLGGITVEGRISNFQKKTDKKGNIICSMVVNGTAISADIQFTLPKNGTTCSASVNSNFRSTSLTFYGKFHPYNSHRILEGQRLF